MSGSFSIYSLIFWRLFPSVLVSNFDFIIEFLFLKTFVVGLYYMTIS